MTMQLGNLPARHHQPLAFATVMLVKNMILDQLQLVGEPMQRRVQHVGVKRQHVRKQASRTGKDVTRRNHLP